MAKADILIIAITLLAALIAWVGNKFLFCVLKPRASAMNFLLYLISVLLLVSGVIVSMGFIVIRFRSFLFE